MAFRSFFDSELVQELIDLTGGANVRFRGEEFSMHFETPTPEIQGAFQAEFRGIAKILVGDRRRWDDLGPERGALIEIDEGSGWEGWKIADWRNTDDGRVVFIALSRAARV